MELTIKEKLNCKDYQSARKIIDYWEKEDEEFVAEFNKETGKTYLWRVGNVRFRVVRRVEWEKLEFTKF